jgi:predicted nuclease of predicted toxin-antitoxin system
MLLFIFDNQGSPRLATGLRILEEGNDRSPLQCEVRHIREYMPGDSEDEVVYKFAGQKDAIVITYDRDFKEISQKARLYKKNKVGVLYFRSTKNSLRYWDLVVSFITQWEELKKLVSETAKPFVFEISLRGIRKIEL